MEPGPFADDRQIEKPHPEFPGVAFASSCVTRTTAAAGVEVIMDIYYY